jgi:hypothetical protein
VIAPHYARPLERACGAHQALVRPRPDAAAEAVSELLPGEDFAVLEYAGGWAWGYCRGDGLVGYVEAIELVAPEQATHMVCEKTAPVAADASVASPVLASFPMGARLHGRTEGACLSTEYGCVPLSYLRPVGECCEDPAAPAERLFGTRFLAGGRSHQGIDDSGLVQLALGMCGLAAPRSAQAQRALGDPVPDGAPARRGDLVFCGDTVGMMLDDLMMIHACPMVGKVTIEPFAVVAERHAAGGPAERRRLPL